MKIKKIGILLLIILTACIGIYVLYDTSYEKKFNYVALGDSIAAGQNPYGEKKGYGYTDYLRDYFNDKRILGTYDNYAISGYTTSDINQDIYNNISIESNNIKRALRESNLVTISIGANDFISKIDLKDSNIFNLDFSSINYKKIIDDITSDVEQTIINIKKYAKGQILVIGYYNPLPFFTTYAPQINEVINYADDKYKEMCKEKDVIYIKVSHLFEKNTSFLPNPLDIHPNTEGYKAIYEEILEYIE